MAHVLKRGKSLHQAGKGIPCKKSSLRAELWSKDLGVPLENRRMGLGSRFIQGARTLGRRIKKTFGPDYALQGINAPAKVLVTRR
jgi:hypothetical protein